MPLTKYLDPLPIPKVIKPKFKHKGIDYYEVRIKEFRQNLHSELPDTKVWGYDGTYPGPTFEVRKGRPIVVKWINCLPSEHLLHAVDTTVHGAGPENPQVRTVTHLH